MEELIKKFKATADLAVLMADKLGLPEDLKKIIYAAGLLQNIGKVASSEEIHHEVGWAFLTKKMGIGAEQILNAVYWSHPILFSEEKRTTADAILAKQKNINKMEGLWSLLQPLLPKYPVLHDRTVEVPKFFDRDDTDFSNKNDNAELMLIRLCVISADCITDMGNPENMENFLDNILKSSISDPISKPKHYDQDRWSLQVDIAKKSLAKDQRTIQVNAPAGFGKTVTAILQQRASGVKTVWVCPRNIVAEAVYDTILKTLQDLNVTCSVELFLTNKRQKSHEAENLPELSADIIVTNIDTIITPMVRPEINNRLFTLFGSNTVFDEFHEIVSSQPLYAGFITYMRARNRISKTCRTLLLSATPSRVHDLWDAGIDKSTSVLPSELAHYPPAHSGTYKFRFETEFPKKAKPGSILVCNSIAECQNNFPNNYSSILHSKYTESDHRIHFDIAMNAFGKDRGIPKDSLTSGLSVQAAMDVSGIFLYDSICGPDNSLQRIGRADRWGRYQGLHPEVIFLDVNSKSETSAVDTVYSVKLKNLWSAYLKNKLRGKESFSLKEIYNIYNEFHIDHKLDVQQYLLSRFKESLNALVTMGPLSYPEPIKEKSTSKPKKARRNLRSPFGTIFYTVEMLNQPGVWVSPDDVLSDQDLWTTYENPDLKKELTYRSKMLFRVKQLCRCGYTGWKKYAKKGISLPDDNKGWFKIARNPATPIPDFSRKYHPILGVIKIKSK